MHKTPFIETVKYQLPWEHWTVDDFLSQDCLNELKSVPVKVQQQVSGKRVGSERLFITDNNQGLYPHLHELWKSLHQGAARDYFEYHTGQDYKNLFPRVEVLSDWGDFYLAPHHDHLEKRLTAMVYTDHEKLYPGTELTNGHRIESKDDRCFFFVPTVDTIHGYPVTHFDSVRRCLQINYWTYSA